MAANIMPDISAHTHGPYDGGCGREKKGGSGKLAFHKLNFNGFFAYILSLSLSVIRHGHIPA